MFPGKSLYRICVPWTMCSLCLRIAGLILTKKIYPSSESSGPGGSRYTFSRRE